MQIDRSKVKHLWIYLKSRMPQHSLQSYFNSQSCENRQFSRREGGEIPNPEEKSSDSNRKTDKQTGTSQIIVLWSYNQETNKLNALCSFYCVERKESWKAMQNIVIQKNWPDKGNFAAGVYLSEAQNPIPPPYCAIIPYLYTVQGTDCHWEGRRVEPERRLEGQRFTKLGRKYQHDWL